MHSKGPWRIDNWDEVDQGGREYVDILDAQGVCICTVVDRDAAIVAAAPEMLEALKYEVEYAGECELDHNGFCQAHGLGRDENGKPDCHVAWYRLIIAKVEGTHGE